MFERRNQPLLPREKFLLRLARSSGIALLVVLASLMLGTCGYHFLEDLSWLDALLNAAMILTGMGPVNTLHTPGAKLFATFFALYSGIVFLSVMAILFVPLAHRLLHRFHVESEKGE